MTAKQLALLRWTCGFRAAHGYSPSFRQMAQGLGYTSPGTTHRLAQKLAERGYIKLTSGGVQVLRPVPVPRAPDGAPLYIVPGIG